MTSLQNGLPSAGQTTASIFCTRRMVSEDVPLAKRSLIVDPEQPIEACKDLHESLGKIFCQCESTRCCYGSGSDLNQRSRSLR